MPDGDAPRVKNLVHEMEVWKQRCAGELITQKNWDATWGFLKTPRTEEPDSAEGQALKKVFDKFDVNKDGSLSVFEFAKMLTSAGKEPPFVSLCKYLSKHDQDSNFIISFNEFVRLAAALKMGKVPGVGPIDVVTMKKPSPSDMLEQSRQDMPKSIQNLLDSGDGDKKDSSDTVPPKFKQRLDKLKPPKERFSHPVTTMQEVGWHKPIEMFGVSHHGRKMCKELWAEKNPDQHRF
eukprot:gnl/MRDRNA2_/MRDRNA2_96369_c0_seq1.p1 gnl/MRDRNA2_/MRDRNA2_96369_c0~~gnl/MRDRNA2_/MRDRNA2_96369_c0_seq1.p1  ORF type:complete len:266 (+),score=64.21 gnl/MRDRNA2_/MRDRNA2_96369_c0_seq1:95-799(+)